MTQEELDALMNNDDISIEDVTPDSEFAPPTPDNEHKLVSQLDTVTKEQEEKAGEIFDTLESILGDAETMTKSIKKMDSKLNKFYTVFDVLHQKFPNIDTFKETSLELNEFQTDMNEFKDSLMGVEDNIMVAMDIMQFTDIHRQKIERVVNVMRSLSRYMDELLSGGEKDDNSRVGVDRLNVEHNERNELMSNNDELEALIQKIMTK